MTVHYLPRKNTNKFADLLVKSFQHSTFVSNIFFLFFLFHRDHQTVEHKRAIKTEWCTLHISKWKLVWRSSSVYKINICCWLLLVRWEMRNAITKRRKNNNNKRKKSKGFVGFCGLTFEHWTLVNCNRNYNNYKSVKLNETKPKIYIITVIISYFYVIARHSFSLFVLLSSEQKQNAKISRFPFCPKWLLTNEWRAKWPQDANFWSKSIHSLVNKV